MGRRPLIQEKKHPFYFKMAPAQQPVDEAAGADTSGTPQTGGKAPEYFMEQVMEGLSDACILVDGGDRIVYVNGSAKLLLRPKGRILGRRLESVLADRQLTMLAADAYHTGKPFFTELALSFPGERWRDDHRFHISIVPLWITATKRLVRIALRDTVQSAHEQSQSAPAAQPSGAIQCGDAMLQMKNPLSIVQGYLENMLDGVINDPVVLRQSLMTMRKHTLAIERLLDSCHR